MKKFEAHAIIFVATHHKHLKYIVLILVLAIILLTMPLIGHGPLSDVWSKWVSPVVGFTTLFVSIAVWIGTEARARVDDLPKRLNVKFKAPFVDKQGVVRKVDDKDEIVEIMSCTMAHLGGEGDLRALAQQIGAQMASPKDDTKQVYLKFTANPMDFQVDDKTSFQEDGAGRLCKVYSMTITLLSAPELIRVAMANATADKPFRARTWDYRKHTDTCLDNPHWQENFCRFSEIISDVNKT